MAGKQPYPPPTGYPHPPAAAYPHPAGAAGYPQPPPGYPQGAPPPYQPPGHTTVVVQQSQPRVVKPVQSHGLMGSLFREVELVGKQLDREVGYVTGKVNSAVMGETLKYFQTGNVVQLTSRASGKNLQVVQQTSTGQLVLDGNGPTDQAFQTLWTVVNEGNNQVRLHSNNNYIAIVNGSAVIVPMPPGSVHGVETKLSLSPIDSQFFLLESAKDSRHHVGILPNGQLKPALSTGRELHAHFAARLVYTPYGQQVHK